MISVQKAAWAQAHTALLHAKWGMDWDRELHTAPDWATRARAEEFDRVLALTEAISHGERLQYGQKMDIFVLMQDISRHLMQELKLHPKSTTLEVEWAAVRAASTNISMLIGS